jgi:hypothetical protein
MDKPRVRVKVEDNGLILGEKSHPFSVAQTYKSCQQKHRGVMKQSRTMRMVDRMDQLEHINAIDTTNLEFGEVLQKEVNGSK